MSAGYHPWVLLYEFRRSEWCVCDILPVRVLYMVNAGETRPCSLNRRRYPLAHHREGDNVHNRKAWRVKQVITELFVL